MQPQETDKTSRKKNRTVYEQLLETSHSDVEEKLGAASRGILCCYNAAKKEHQLPTHTFSCGDEKLIWKSQKDFDNFIMSVRRSCPPSTDGLLQLTTILKQLGKTLFKSNHGK